jgi:uncharacterized BrkB/YihY/UPF0761 family membrane protein
MRVVSLADAGHTFPHGTATVSTCPLQAMRDDLLGDVTTTDGRPPGGRMAGARARGESNRVWLGSRLDDVRHRSTAADALARAWEHDVEVGGGLLAGALAFRLFLFMVPLTLVGFTLLGSVTNVLDSSPTEMAHAAGVSGVLAKGIFTTSALTATHQTVLLVFGTYALLSTARSVVGTIVSAHCLAWRMPTVKMKRLRPALLFVAFVSTISVLSSRLAQLRAAAPAPGLALTVLWILLPLVAWWWASSKLPHGDAPVWALLPGALVFAAGMQALHVFTLLYVVPSVDRKSETYGAIGVALVVLAWSYVAGRLVTATAVINAALWRRFQDRHPDEVRTAPAAGGGASSPVRLGLTWLRSAGGLLR